MYGIIHDSIFDSSLMAGRDPDDIMAAYVLMCMVTIADSADDVTDRREVLCVKFNVSRFNLDRAIAELEAPDPTSRSKDADGRRLVRLHENRDWGWRVVNRERYKFMRDMDERRKYQRDWDKANRPTRPDRHPTRARVVPTNPTKAVGSRQEAVDKRQKKRKDTGTAPRSPRARFVPPTLEDVKAYCEERANAVDPQSWLNHYESNGWRVGRNPMRSWKAAVRTWERNRVNAAAGAGPPGSAPRPNGPDPALEKARRQREEWEREQRDGNSTSDKPP